MSAPAHQIWLVWAPGLPDLRDEVRATRGRPARRPLTRCPRDVPVQPGVPTPGSPTRAWSWCASSTSADRPDARRTGRGPTVPTTAPSGVLRLRALRADTRAQEDGPIQRAWSVEVSVVLARLRRPPKMAAAIDHIRGDCGSTTRGCRSCRHPRRPGPNRDPHLDGCRSVGRWALAPAVGPDRARRCCSHALPRRRPRARHLSGDRRGMLALNTAGARGQVEVDGLTTAQTEEACEWDHSGSGMGASAWTTSISKVPHPTGRPSSATSR